MGALAPIPPPGDKAVPRAPSQAESISIVVGLIGGERGEFVSMGCRVCGRCLEQVSSGTARRASFDGSGSRLEALAVRGRPARQRFRSLHASSHGHCRDQSSVTNG